MKKVCLGMFSLMIACALTASIFVPESSGMLIKQKMSKFVREADSIVVGKVVRMRSKKMKGLIYTDVFIRVNETLKGRGKRRTVKIRIPGGTIGKLTLTVSDTPEFKKGEQVLVLSRKGKIVGWERGKFSIKRDKIQVFGAAIPLKMGRDIIKGCLKSPQRMDRLEAKVEEMMRAKKQEKEILQNLQIKLNKIMELKPESYKPQQINPQKLHKPKPLKGMKIQKQ